MQAVERCLGCGREIKHQRCTIPRAVTGDRKFDSLACAEAWWQAQDQTGATR
jgi:hypothetical protein